MSGRAANINQSVIVGKISASEAALKARPVPPVEAFADSETPIFVPAPDIAAWFEHVFLDERSPTYNPDHAHLRDAHIGFLWTSVENTKKGRRIIGQCEVGSPQGAMGKWSRARVEMQVVDWFGSIPDFIVTLDADYCAHCGDAEFMALVEHEAYHAAQDIDAFGMPKFRKDGSPAFTIRGHDVEEFVGVVRRYGADASGVRAMVEAAKGAPEVSAAKVGHACGTCHLRVA